ncbi:ribokinase [soil metagenome]
MIAVVGGYGVGMTMRVERAPEAGETVSGGVLSSGPGGKGSNQAIAIARLGHSSSIFTAIGDDSAGRDGEDLWAAERVVSAAVMKSEPTMAAFITVEASGENRISIAPGALESLSPGDVESYRDSIRDADLLVVSLEVPWVIARRCLEIAREEGTRTLVNPAPAHTLEVGDWALIDVLTPNATEAAILTGDGDGSAEGLAGTIAALGCDVVLTVGENGAVVADHEGITRIDPVTVPRVVDTTGAGDAFTAALAVGLVEGMSLRDAARFAAAAGAHAVTVAEVIPALPTREQIAVLLGDKEPA